LIILVALLSNGCSHEAPTEDVDKAAAQFFLRVKGAQYNLIYNDAADKFKTTKSKAELQNSLEQLLATGKPEQWIRINMNFNDRDKSRFAEPDYMLETDRNRVLVNLTFVDDNGEWKLMGFRANPNAWGKQ